MSARCFFVCVTLLLLFASGADAARYQRTRDGKTLVWNNLRGVAEQATWSGARDANEYATGEGTLTWYRLGNFVNSYTGKMVRGKFEGPVIREQGQTRLQVNFVDGNKVGDWMEPGSTRTPAPAAKEKSNKPSETPPIEEPLVEQPSPLPTSTPTPTPTPTPIPSPSSTPTPKPTPIPTPSPSPTPTSTPTPSSTVSPTQQPGNPMSRSEEIVEKPVQDSLELASPPSSLRNVLEEVPWVEPSPSSRISPTPSPTALPRGGDPKQRMIAEFKKQIESVLAQVNDATGNFREIDRLDHMQILPAPVSARVTLLAGQAREFRLRLGDEVTFYQCLAEMETVEALVLVDEMTRDVVAKDAPAARKKLSSFLKRYSGPSTDYQKSLWRYLTSALALCERSKNEAEVHLQQAKSLESAGKKSDALREHQEIYRIYPNPITAEKIRQLESPPR